MTVTTTDELRAVRAVSVSGALVYSDGHCGTQVQFQLQPGAYIIEAETASGRKTMKVFVR